MQIFILKMFCFRNLYRLPASEISIFHSNKNLTGSGSLFWKWVPQDKGSVKLAMRSLIGSLNRILCYKPDEPPNSLSTFMFCLSFWVYDNIYWVYVYKFVSVHSENLHIRSKRFSPSSLLLLFLCFLFICPNIFLPIINSE